MQADQKPVIWTVIIASIILLIGGIFAVGSIGNKLSNGLDVMNVKLSGLSIDEQAIANAIVAGITMPTMPEFPEMPSSNRIDELWEAQYGKQVDGLKVDAHGEASWQFMDDNDEFSVISTEALALGVLYDEGGSWFFFEDDNIYDLVTESVDCDGDCGVMYVKEYGWKNATDNDREIEVINLGLDDEDDRVVELSTVIRVKVFTDEDDNEEYFFERVHIDSVVTSDDGELEAEVTYSL